MTTKDIEKIAYDYLWKKGRYMVFEMAVPREIQNKYHRERLDLIAYDSDGTFRGYEIKRNLNDFRSGCAWSWICHYNYFIMPNDLYQKIQDEIPEDIGVWVCYEGYKVMHCVKKPKRKKLLCSKEAMLLAMLQSLSREYKKYRKLKGTEKKKSSTKKRTSKKSKEKQEQSFCIDDILLE